MSLNNRLPPDPSSQQGRFATTSWSLVVQAADDDSQYSRPALESLCTAYWYPLYAFVRRRGFDRDTTEDLTQSFFLNLLETGGLAAADQNRGRFRTFLLSSLDNFLKKDWRKQQASRRGGDRQVLSIDYDQAEQRYRNEPFHELTAERIFERSWALTLLETTVRELEAQYQEAGKAELFDELRPFLAGSGPTSYATLADRLALSESAIKVNVYRMRQRWQELLRSRIRETLENPQDVDKELGDLFAAFDTSRQ